ncbi:MAG: c-type cytochrome [Boseongicola sp.]|nr:c-type cytochrome [Boseongicola sp.]
MRRLGVFAVCLMASAAWGETPDANTGAWYFARFCAACHGERAMGDGPMQEVLTLRAPDLTQLSAGNDGVFPVTRVVRQIDGRDPMLAHGGEMPLFGELFAFPDAALPAETGQPIVTAQPIADLTAWLESIQE